MEFACSSKNGDYIVTIYIDKYKTMNCKSFYDPVTAVMGCNAGTFIGTHADYLVALRKEPLRATVWA